MADFVSGDRAGQERTFRAEPGEFHVPERYASGQATSVRHFSLVGNLLLRACERQNVELGRPC